MKTHLRTGMGLVALVIAAAALGCAPMPGAQGPVAVAPQPAENPGGGAGVAAPPSAAAAPQAASVAAEVPTTEAECGALAGKPTGEISSSSDPQKQLHRVFQDNHENFRCCVDALFAPKAGRADASVALVVTLDSAGKLTSSDVVQSETSAQAPAVHACINGRREGAGLPEAGKRHGCALKARLSVQGPPLRALGSRRRSW